MAKNTIKLKNYVNIQEEYAAAAAITPGHLIELTSANTVRVHATEGGNVLPMIALEDDMQGKGIDDAYAAGDRVQVWIPTRGDIAYGILKDGENVVVGDFLASAGDGTLKKHVNVVDNSADVETIVPEAIVAVALEAVDMTGSAGEDPDPRIQVRIL